MNEENATESAIRQSETITDAIQNGSITVREAIDELSQPVSLEGEFRSFRKSFPATESDADTFPSPVAYPGNPVVTTSNGYVGYNAVNTPIWNWTTEQSPETGTKSEIELRELAIEAACKAFGYREVELSEFGQALDYFYNYLKYGTKLDFGK